MRFDVLSNLQWFYQQICSRKKLVISVSILSEIFDNNRLLGVFLIIIVDRFDVASNSSSRRLEKITDISNGRKANNVLEFLELIGFRGNNELHQISIA